MPVWVVPVRCGAVQCSSSMQQQVFAALVVLLRLLRLLSALPIVHMSAYPLFVRLHPAVQHRSLLSRTQTWNPSLHKVDFVSLAYE